jgi:fructoselysine-6-P-deglycase FrlB-like protein
VDPVAFLTDLTSKPDHLARLARHLASADPWERFPSSATQVVFLGMGSSHYAASVSAARLQARGVQAVAVRASSALLPPAGPGTVIVAISATGSSKETVAAVGHYVGRCPIVLLTNTEGSALAAAADLVVPMLAGPEAGGVACRSFQHTLALLLALEARLTGAGHEPARLAPLVTASAEATSDLLDRREDWLPEVSRLLLGPDGTHIVAPDHRLSSAQQSALMLREGPRRPAVGCETGDWSHVDVYLTKTTDYRMLLLAGSPWEPELLTWTSQRGSTIVSVGADLPQAAVSLRYRGDEDDDVRLLTETLVAELVAASAWLRATGVEPPA